LVVEQPKFTRVEEPTFLCNHNPRCGQNSGGFDSREHLQILEVVATERRQATLSRKLRQSAALRRSFFIHKAVYGFALRRAREGASWLAGFGSPLPQLLRSSLGAPAGGVLVVLSMQGIALRYS
jgi:hypothetical protein